ncbi:arsenic transporter [Mucilaginibacter flavus]|uniref:arsenic transporter n=1 Tax=Mucilaginibacter flavus TaxID=931504 RepID=UPI0025B4735A|nr:arsenic transporter [Mucilaginibacter flavus]MDN3580794.1 arsenic transporter [Mucilaginibacter flavus]
MTNLTIWIISFFAIAGVIIRPFKVPEFVWALTGAIVLLIAGLISPTEGLNGASKGTDVYLFLTGMMLLAETAREEKLFDWLAAHATKMANGSSVRLFLLIYLVGVVVTSFLSNDATAVVLTPAVAAAVKAAKVNKPLPYLFICAFIANAASFILPISNPANLVIYGSHMPALIQWLHTYALPSAVAVAVTYGMLYLTQLKNLKQAIESEITIPTLSTGGKTALIGIAATAAILLISSAFDIQLGLPTAITGIVTSAIVIISAKKNPVVVIKGVSWSVLPLVAGLFVIVEALGKTGLIQNISTLLQQSLAHSLNGTVWAGGIITAFSCNLMNNLPAGLIAGNAVQAGHVPAMVKSAILIGIDLGPNLSITGSLATILWLVALRREGITVSAWSFLKLGFIVMTVALLCTLGALWV